MVKEIRARFIEKIPRTGSVESFRFTPAESPGFLPGQAAQLIFDENNRNNRELNKYLSFSSSPERAYVEFTKRISSSAFSKQLENLKSGDEVLLKAPVGNCVFRDDYAKIGFLIGGIGITPVISIIEHIMDKKLTTDALLLYSNRTDDDIAFKEELDRWQALNKNIKVSYIVTDCQPKDNTCIRGVIDKEMVSEKVYELNKRIFFLFGPPGMVAAMNNLCLDLGCSGENIKAENFVGY
ncbi:MAG: FAD-dependent oxidoreductase [Candidatus Omnitrophota bacterium]